MHIGDVGVEFSVLVEGSVGCWQGLCKSISASSTITLFEIVEVAIEADREHSDVSARSHSFVDKASIDDLLIFT